MKTLLIKRVRRKVDIFDIAKLTDELDYTPKWKLNVGADIKLLYNSLLNLMGRYVGERLTYIPIWHRDRFDIN